MKYLVYTGILVLCTTMVMAQSINCEWAEFANGEYNTFSCLDHDEHNNVFVMGVYKGIDLENYSLTTQNTNSTFNTFVVKYNSDGEMKWLNSYGDVGFTRGKYIRCDKENNVLFAIEFIDSILVHGTTYYTDGSPNVLVVKLDNDGQLVWVRLITSEKFVSIRSFEVSGNGRMLVLVDCFGNTPVHFDGLSGEGYRILASYDENGTTLWIRTVPGSIRNSGSNPLVTDQAGNIYFTGNFIDSITFADTTINAKGYWHVDYWQDSSYFRTDDFFLAKMDMEGSDVWIRTIGTNGTEYGDRLAVCGSTVFVVGEYSDTAFLGLPSSIFSDDEFLLSYSADGALLNAEKIGPDDNGISNMTFGDITCNDDYLLITGKRNGEVYLDKLNWDLDLVQSFETGGPNFDYGVSVKINNENDIYLGGHFINEIQFGDCETIDRGSSFKIFLAKLNNNLVPINTVEITNNVDFFPNPFQDDVSFVLDEVENVLNLNIVDSKGSIVFSNYSDAQSTENRTLDLSHLNNGIYFATVVFRNKVIVRQIIKINAF